MSVSSSPRSASPAFSASTVDAGPQSKIAGPSSVSRTYEPTYRGAPWWWRSIGSMVGSYEARARAASTIVAASERLPQPRVSVCFDGSSSL